MTYGLRKHTGMKVLCCQLRAVDHGGAVGLGNSFAIAVGEIDIVALIVKPVHFTAIVFKQVLDTIGIIVFGRS